MFRRVLVAFDGSPSAWRALRRGIDLVRDQGAELWMIIVEETPPQYASRSGAKPSAGEAVAQRFDQLQEEARREAARHGVTLRCERVRGHPAEAIVRYADQIGADLIVIGQHGRAGLLEHVLGSTGDRVVDLAHCSVLVVRGDH